MQSAFALLASAALLAFAAGLPITAGEAHWPQFRGPGGLGIAADNARPPLHFNPQSNVLWRVASPSGHSSPILWGQRLFLTGYADGKLLALGYDLGTGRPLWRREIVTEKIEEVHPSLGNPASATPVTDGERLYLHFGSLGLLALDLEGRELWRRPLKLTQTEYGASSSPILAGDHVIQLLDQDGDSHAVAVDRRTGSIRWRVDRPEMRRGFGTPITWAHHGRTDLVLPGTLWLTGLDPATGRERWRVSGLARITCTSPAVGDGLLLAASWTTGGDHGTGHLLMPPFDEVVRQRDLDGDGKLTFEELPPGPAKDRFKHLDGNRNGLVERAEWVSMADIFARVENQAFAVRPTETGEISEDRVLWRFKKGLPYVGSPLHYQGRFYMVKDGGMLTCLDPQTGTPHYQEERLGPVGPYYASLVAADGRLYVAAQRGTVVVVAAGDKFSVLARNELGELLQATPAVHENTLFIRSAAHLTAYGDPGPH